MTEIGLVKAFDSTSNTVTIEFNAHGACKSCGVCLIGNGNDHSHMQLTAKNTLNAQVGDTVEFEVRPGAMLQASMLIYGFPLAMLLLGFVIGKALATTFSLPQDMTCISGALIMFAFSFYVLSLKKSTTAEKITEHIRITRVAKTDG